MVVAKHNDLLGGVWLESAKAQETNTYQIFVIRCLYMQYMQFAYNSAK